MRYLADKTAVASLKSHVSASAVHSFLVSAPQARNKGRISRYLANKASIASRIDCFMEVATSAFGDKMKEQVRGLRRSAVSFTLSKVWADSRLKVAR